MPGTVSASILAQMNQPAEIIRPANSSVSRNRHRRSDWGRIETSKPFREPGAGLLQRSEELVSEWRLIWTAVLPVNTLFCAVCSRMFNHPSCYVYSARDPVGRTCPARRSERFQGTDIELCLGKIRKLPNQSGAPLPGPASETRRPRQRRWRCTPAPRMRQPPNAGIHHKTAGKRRKLVAASCRPFPKAQ